MSEDSMDEDEFTPKENIEDSPAEDEKFLNRGTGEFAPKAIVYGVMLVFSGVGFAVGYSLLTGVVTGTLCLLQIMSSLVGSPQQIAGTDSITLYAKEEMMMCMGANLATPLPILAGVVGGVLVAYPAYKVAKTITSDKYLKSLV